MLLQDLDHKSETLRKLDELRTSLENSGLYLNIMVIGFGSADPAELSELADNGIFMEEATDFTSDDLTNNTSKSLCTRPVPPTGNKVVSGRSSKSGLVMLHPKYCRHMLC